MQKILIYTGLLCFALFFGQCRKLDVITESNATLRFSTDTVTFDTIFTSIGSATQSFRVYNPYSRPIIISSVELAGGENSKFRLNIDGHQVNRMQNIELYAKDSLYIFVEVTLDPNEDNNPLVVKDSISFMTNGNYQDIKLIAFGQDVHLINGEYVGTETWTADKPYLIYNSMAVEENEILTIEEGVQVYFHGIQSSMLVLGSLRVNGSKDNPVVFQGDRLEEFYDHIPGQWGTIVFFPESRENMIEYAVIKNAIAGIQIGFYDDFSLPDLILKNTVIKNMSFVGIYAFGAKLKAQNTVVANCSEAALSLLRGGEYRFLHCTVSNQGDFYAGHSVPSIVITNRIFIDEPDSLKQSYITVEYVDDLKNASFHNCILYGSLENEIQLEDNGENLFQYKFDHCLIKNHPDSLDSDNTQYFNKVIFNDDPHFISTVRDELDLQLDTLSPAKDAGDPGLILQLPDLGTDINGNSRTQEGLPDLGAYERIETDTGSPENE